MTTVDDYIALCDEAISAIPPKSPSELEAISDEIKCAFNPFIAHISNYRGANPSSTYSVADIKKLRGKLAVYRDEKRHELEIARLNAAQRGAIVNISDVGNSSSISNSAASASNMVTISQAIEAVENDPSLTDEQKAEIQMMLAEAKSAAARGDKGLFARAGSRILGTIEQAAPALIVKVLEFLVSQATGLGA